MNNTSADADVQAALRAQSAIRFVDALEVEVLSPPMIPAGAALSGGASAAVDAGSVVAFTDALDGQQKADVLNSTLLAQLAANSRHDRLLLVRPRDAAAAGR